MNLSYKYFELILNLLIFLIFFSETQTNLSIYRYKGKDFHRKNLKEN